MFSFLAFTDANRSQHLCIVTQFGLRPEDLQQVSFSGVVLVCAGVLKVVEVQEDTIPDMNNK